jgi:hypothetical protein
LDTQSIRSWQKVSIHHFKIIRLFSDQLKRLRTWQGWRRPAVEALTIQCFVFLLIGLLILIFNSFELPGFQALSVGYVVVLQGVAAALITAKRRLARWWIVIQFAFPPALLTTLAMHLPPVLYLVAFCFLVMLYWSTFRTQVPFYPSNLPAWKAVATLLPEGQPLNVIDIGSGLGGFVLWLAAQRRDCVVSGIELAPLPWLISWLRGHMGRQSTTFFRGDYDALDFAQFDVVFAYLSPAAMPALWKKMQQEMRPGALLLSYEFEIPGQTPAITVLPNPHGPALYGWRR